MTENAQSPDVDQFVRFYEDAIEGIEPNSLEPSTKYHEMAQWDSLALLCLIAMIDCEYEVQIAGADLRACDTLQDVYDLVSAKKAS
ncbi:MAG: phosphopantetheine-binding protein [Opitutaceae bacterium]